MYIQKTKFYCSKCGTHDHWANEPCMNAAPVELPAHLPEEVTDPSTSAQQPQAAAPIEQAKAFLRKVGRPSLNRSLKEKRSMRREYMRRLRAKNSG